MIPWLYLALSTTAVALGIALLAYRLHVESRIEARAAAAPRRPVVTLWGDVPQHGRNANREGTT